MTDMDALVRWLATTTEGRTVTMVCGLAIGRWVMSLDEARRWL